jgi:hypothetical protein
MKVHPLANAFQENTCDWLLNPEFSGLDFRLAHRTPLLTATQRICQSKIRGLRIFLKGIERSALFRNRDIVVGELPDVPQATLGK